MKTKIQCTETVRGKHSFYLTKEGVKYYMFSQDYRSGVQKYYGCAVPFDDAIDFTRANKDHAVMRTMEKILLYTKYIEREYKITVYKKSDTKQTKKSNKCVYA